MNSEFEKSIQSAEPAQYGSDYRNHLLEQYKLYVEMADKISERRQEANTFFLAVNSAIIAALGIAWPMDAAAVRLPWFIVGAVVGLILCLAWHRLLKSYRDLNSAKFRIVGILEGLLPVRPYAAEWQMVDEGRVSKPYLPFSHIETKIPLIFAVLYLGIAVLIPWYGRGMRDQEKRPTTVYFEGDAGCFSSPPTSGSPAGRVGAVRVERAK